MKSSLYLFAALKSLFKVFSYIFQVLFQFRSCFRQQHPVKRAIQKEKLRWFSEKDDNECPEKKLSIPAAGKTVRFSKSHRNVPCPEIKL